MTGTAQGLSPRQRMVFFTALLLVTTHFSLAYIAETAPFLSMRAFAAGQEAQPFQERALTAWLLHATGKLDSPQLESALHRALPAMGAGFNETTLVLMLVCWVSMMASILLTRASLRLLTEDIAFSSAACFFVPYMAYFTYILNFGPHFLLPYDLPSLFFFCAGFYLLLTRRFLVLLALIAAATLNRETSLFLIAFYLVFAFSDPLRRQRRGAIAAYAVAMLVLWIAMRAIVLHLYGHNPVDGSNRLADLKLWQNLGFLFKPQHWPALVSVFGFALPLVFIYRQSIEPAWLRRGLWIVALWFALMLVVGVIIEIRIFGELIAYVSLALGVLVHRWLHQRRTSLQAA